MEEKKVPRPLRSTSLCCDRVMWAGGVCDTALDSSDGPTRILYPVSGSFSIQTPASVSIDYTLVVNDCFFKRPLVAWKVLILDKQFIVLIKFRT